MPPGGGAALPCPALLATGIVWANNYLDANTVIITMLLSSRLGLATNTTQGPTLVPPLGTWQAWGSLLGCPNQLAWEVQQSTLWGPSSRLQLLGSGIWLLFGFGLDSDAIHSPNEHYGVFNYFKGIETIPLFYKYYAEEKGNA